MDRKPILFSESNAYFPYEELLQNRIWFSNTLDIDTYVKESFGVLTDKIMITGGDIQCFSKDHLIDEEFICYKIEGLNHTALIKSEGMIKYNLGDQGLLKKGLIQWIIQGSPILSLIILNIITRILPGKIANVLMYVSIVGLIITCCFYSVKIIKRIIKRFFSKEIKANGIGILLEKQDDIRIINKELALQYKELYKNCKIEEIVILEWSVFLKQKLKEESIRESIKGKFQKKQKKDHRDNIQTTIDFILNQNLFI